MTEKSTFMQQSLNFGQNFVDVEFNFKKIRFSFSFYFCLYHSTKDGINIIVALILLLIFSTLNDLFISCSSRRGELKLLLIWLNHLLEQFFGKCFKKHFYCLGHIFGSTSKPPFRSGKQIHVWERYRVGWS